MDSEQQVNIIKRESLVNILEIMHNLTRHKSLPALLLEVLEVGREAIVAEAGLLWLWDDDKQTLEELICDSAERETNYSAQGWALKCAQQGQISNIHDCVADPISQQHPMLIAGEPARSLLNVPVLGDENDVIGVMQWLGAEPGQFDNQDEWIAPTLAAQAAVAIEHQRLTEHLLATAALGQEVEIAHQIQRSTLPGEMPSVTGYDLHGHFQPADHTGGDLFDVVMLEQQLFLLLGDATGHGFGPALSATQMQAMLRVAFRLDADLESAYIQVNNQLEEDLPDDRFITAFVGFLDPQSHRVTYYSGGQGPILIYRAASDDFEWHKPTHFPLGVMPMQAPLQSAQIDLLPGDVLALISDGVYEYNNPSGEEFGEQRVAQIIRDTHKQDISAICQGVLSGVQEFAKDVVQADDITMVLVRRSAE